MALMTFEQLDRSIDADSDSDDDMAEQAHIYKSKAILAGIILANREKCLPIKARNTRLPNSLLVFISEAKAKSNVLGNPQDQFIHPQMRRKMTLKKKMRMIRLQIEMLSLPRKSREVSLHGKPLVVYRTRLLLMFFSQEGCLTTVNSVGNGFTIMDFALD
jgi:hypothetical protein